MNQKTATCLISNDLVATTNVVQLIDVYVVGDKDLTLGQTTLGLAVNILNGRGEKAQAVHQGKLLNRSTGSITNRCLTVDADGGIEQRSQAHESPGIILVVRQDLIG